MALSSETNKTIFNCTGGTTYSADFKIFEDADVEVVYVDTDGSETTLTLTTDYSISNKTDSGFTITTVSTYSDGTLVARRSQAQTQDIDYTQNDIFSTEVLEEQLDKFAMMIQELQEQVDRSILASVTQTSSFTLPSGEADKLIGWNSDGDGLENKTALDTDVQAACEAAQTAAESAQTSAEAAQTAAESAAAKVPDISAGDAYKLLQVKSDESGNEYNAISTDTTLAGNSDTEVVSEKAIKTYADTKATKGANTDITSLTGLTGDVYNTAWTDYSSSSTVVGWSGYTTKQIYYKKVGKLVFVAFYINGTSDATSVTFTLPDASNFTIRVPLGVTHDNGSSQTSPGLIAMTPASATVTVYKTLAEGAWTNSGAKMILGQFWYEISS